MHKKYLAVSLNTLRNEAHRIATEKGFSAEQHPAVDIALMHSELSEALEGYRKGLMDDKLPHRPMVEVEFADTIIRICDCAGGLGLDLGGAIREKLAYNAQREDHKAENRRLAGGKTI